MTHAPETHAQPPRPLSTQQEQLIGDDVRLSYPECSNTEAMGYLLNVVSLTPAMGACVFVDDGTATSAAIHALLLWHQVRAVRPAPGG